MTPTYLYLPLHCDEWGSPQVHLHEMTEIVTELLHNHHTHSYTVYMYNSCTVNTHMAMRHTHVLRETVTIHFKAWSQHNT